MAKAKYILLLLLAVSVAGIGSWLILVNPNNPLTNLFQKPISDINERIIIGPYPNERDFRLLKQNHIELVVSLLDPAIPYEASLLERERLVAEKYQIPLQNFPMSSILGHKFGNDYDLSAKQAASAIANTHNKVYLHCYLGIHRVRVVQDILAEQGIQAGKYAIRAGERDKSLKLLDNADAAYNNGKYQDAIDILAQIDANQFNDNMRLLQAWSFYRIGNVPQAESLFNTFLSSNPDNPQAKLGLGYCAYRSENNSMAEQFFLQALEKLPHNADALAGLGLVYYRSNRLTEAVAKLKESLSIAPNNQELRNILTKADSQLNPQKSQDKRIKKGF